MNSTVTKFACTPYLTPPPTNPNIKTTKLPHESTLLTFFDGFDHSIINDSNEKKRMLNDLDNNIFIICNLQSDRLPNGAEPNKSNGTFMTYLTNLKECHPFSLCPLPKFDTLELDYLINHCLSLHIPIEKSVWAIHHYAIKKEISAEMMTDALVKIHPTDIYFFCKLCKGIYCKNLLNHTSFLKWCTANILPKYLKDFEKDFIKTHSLLYYALTSHNSTGKSNFPLFYEIFQKSLIINQSHIIQFSILCENQKLLTLNEAECIYQLITNNNILKRTRQIHQLLISNEFKSDYSSNLQYMLPIIIFKDFPHYNLEIILNDIRRATFFLKQSKQSKIALNLCKIVLSNFNDPVNISAIVAWLLKKLRFKLEIESFTEWIYSIVESTFSDESDQNIEKLQSLLYELEYQDLFDYKRFHSYIHKKRYFQIRSKSTEKVITELPILLYDLRNRSFHFNKILKGAYIKRANECVNEVMYDLSRLFQSREIVKKMKEIKSDIFGSIEIIKELPFLYRFVTSVTLICENDKIDAQKRLTPIELFHFLNRVNVLCLIPEISKKTDFVPINAKRFLAVYETHGLYNKIKPSITARDESPLNLVNNSLVSEFFATFSNFCSLHVLDLSFSVRTRGDLTVHLSLLFDDLLSFRNISYSHFFQFFSEFCHSKIVPDCVTFYLTLFLSSCYLKRHVDSDVYIIEKERLNWPMNDVDNEKAHSNFSSVFSFASHFVRDLFSRRIIRPCEFILICFDIAKAHQEEESRSPGYDEADLLGQIFRLLESLFQILFDFIELSEKPSFESNEFLTIEVVNRFDLIISMYDLNQPLKKSIESLYHNFLTHLRPLKPPQFNAQPPRAFAMALFTLLPTELFSDDFGTIIDFFLKHVSRANVHLWCSWLRDCTEYQPGFPVVRHEPFPESKKLKYITELVDTFWTDRGIESIADELLNECRWILCQSNSISNAVIQKCINKSYFNFPCLHPALVYADELIVECLCDTLKETNSVLGDDYVVAASSVFIFFVAKFCGNYKYFSLIINIANKILEWILRLWEDESLLLMNLIDTFNFIICWSFDHSSDDLSARSSESATPSSSGGQSQQLGFKGFGSNGSFQDMLHSKIISNLKKLPHELRRKIILNKPRQAFKVVQNPMFLDFASQENDSGSQFQIHSTFNEGGEGNYHNFGFFDDDVVEQLFWG